VVALLLDRGADIHAFHGTGMGAGQGWWAQDVQAIDLAVWGGPPGLGPPRATHRHTKIAKLLLDRGAGYGLTIAAARGDLKRVTEILDEDPGAIRQPPRNGRRPLSAAVEFGHGDMVRLLLDRGADPNWPELGSPTGGALQRAAGAGNREWVELLLAHGADPNSLVDSGGNATFAAKTPELRALLTSRGGEIDSADLVWIAGDDEVMRSVTEDPRAAERDWGALLPPVCTNGRRDLLARLLRAGLRVPQVVTGCQGYLLDNVEMLGMLLKSGMNPDLQNWQGQTLLHLLGGGAQTEKNRVKCAAMLLDAGASISVRDDEYHSTPLGWAARAGVLKMVELLLERGAVTHLPDDEPWATPLAWAQRQGHAEIVERLRNNGASR
jgi:ankyrin repeat protein